MESLKKIVKVGTSEDLLRYCSFGGEKSILTVDIERIEKFARDRKIKYELIDSLQNIDQKIIDEKCNNKKDSLIILLSQNYDIEIVAKYYAKKTKRELSTMTILEFEKYVKDVKNKQKEIFVIADIDIIEQIENIVSMNNWSLNIGIIWGNGRDDLLYKLNKIILCSDEKCQRMVIVDRTDRKSEQSIFEDYRVYVPHANSSKNNFEEAISEKAEVLAFVGHGRDELLWLTQGVLCAGPKNVVGKRVPNCNNCGECFKQNVDIMKISDVNVTNCFIQSCTGGNMTGTIYGREYGLLDNFWDNNVVSYISTPYLCNEFNPLVHYYAAQVAVGRGMGEITKKINDYYFDYGVGNRNEFFLVGDPEYKVQSKYDEKRVIVSADLEEFEILLDEKSPLMIIEVRNLSIKDFFSLEKEVVIHNSAGQVIYSNIYNDENANKSLIEIFTNGILAEGKYKIKIKNRRAVNLMGISEIEYVYEIGVMDQSSKRFYEESFRVIKNFDITQNTLMANSSQIANHVYTKYDKLVNRIYKIDEQINNTLRNKVQKNGLLFDELCLSEGFKYSDKKLSNRKCPYCNGTLTEKYISNKINRISRVHLFCNTCGMVEDRPVNTSIKAEFSPLQNSLNKTGKNKVSIILENIGERDVHGIVSVAVVNGGKDDFSYEPGEIKIDLAKGNKLEESFIISQSENVASHNYWLIAILTFETEIQIITRNIFYGE